MLLRSHLAGLPAFLVYFCTGVVAVVLYLFVYMRITPHDEFRLIRDNVPAAAISLGLSLLGFVLPVMSAIVHSANVWDCLIWSVIALIVQVCGVRRGADSGAEPVGKNCRRRTRGCDLARPRLARGRLAQRRLDGHLNVSDDLLKEFGRRKPQAAGWPNTGAAAGETLPPRRAAADGHGRGRRRRLCADAVGELRQTRPAWRQFRDKRARAPPPTTTNSSRMGRRSTSGYYSGGSSAARTSPVQRRCLVRTSTGGSTSSGQFERRGRVRSRQPAAVSARISRSADRCAIGACRNIYKILYEQV